MDAVRGRTRGVRALQEEKLFLRASGRTAKVLAQWATPATGHIAEKRRESVGSEANL